MNIFTLPLLLFNYLMQLGVAGLCLWGGIKLLRLRNAQGRRGGLTFALGVALLLIFGYYLQVMVRQLFNFLT